MIKLIYILIITMQVNFNIDRAVFNKAYIPFINDNTPTQIFFGGASSGKSTFLIGQRMILDLLKGGRNYLCTRHVSNTLRDSIYNEAIKGIYRLKAERLFQINKTDMTITCVNGYQAIMKGLDDVHKIKSITPQKGVITDILMEEAPEDEYDDYKELTKRMRGLAEKPKRMTIIFNPVYKEHWIYREFFTSVGWGDNDTFYKDDNILILKTTYLDNKFLMDEDIVRLENEKDEYYYNVYTLGNWGIRGKLVFNNWIVDDLSDMKNQFDYYRNGLDFGFTNDPAAFIRTAKHHGKIYLLDELYEYGMGNNLFADMMKPLVGRESVFCDSAEPKSIFELTTYNIHAFPCVKGKDSVHFGIKWLNGFEIVIHKYLQNTINEFSLYQWKRNKDGVYLNIPLDKDNHIPDALRYAYSTDVFEQRHAEIINLNEYV